MGEYRSAIKILTGKPSGKRPRKVRVSRLSANDMGDSELIPGAVHRSPLP